VHFRCPTTFPTCIENGPAQAHIRIGWLRSVANIYHAFGVQTFSDELAHRANRDPLDYLLDLIGQPRTLDFTGVDYAADHHFSFDTVQMPLNVMDVHFDSFEKAVLPVLVKNGTGVLAMKPMGDHFILESKTATPVECLHYPMNLPTSVVITGCDSLAILEQALQAARTFKPMNDAEVSALLAKTAPASQDGKYELYKTSHHFDGTFANPQWLG
jgi:hypothetical protein